MNPLVMRIKTQVILWVKESVLLHRSHQSPRALALSVSPHTGKSLPHPGMVEDTGLPSKGSVLIFLRWHTPATFWPWLTLTSAWPSGLTLTLAWLPQPTWRHSCSHSLPWGWWGSCKGGDTGVWGKCVDSTSFYRFSLGYFHTQEVGWLASNRNGVGLISKGLCPPLGIWILGCVPRMQNSQAGSVLTVPEPSATGNLEMVPVHLLSIFWVFSAFWLFFWEEFLEGTCFQQIPFSPWPPMLCKRT